MGFFSSILDLLYPPRCIFCRAALKTGESGLCASCVQNLPFTGGGFVRSGDFFTGCIAALYYEGNVRDSILRYKFSEAKGYAETYGRLMADCIRDNLSGRYDLISWVPLSEKRLKKRGYDQAMLLAMATALQLDDVAVETLQKHSDVPAQSGMVGEKARRDNISGAYHGADLELIKDKRILLIDDIVTTGSTLSECAKVLLKSGADEVLCTTLACTRSASDFSGDDF